MAIMEFGIGGNEVRVDASESIADIPGNRTILIEQLTAEESVNPEVVTGLTSIDQVFAHYKPKLDVELENADGQSIKETLHFSSVGDFAVKNVTAQSPFLSKLNVEKEFYENLKKQLRSNKVLQKALENADTREAMLVAFKGVIEEINAADKD